MRPLTAAEVAVIVRGDLRGDPDVRVDRVATDTRNPLRAGDLFIGLPGPRFDGSAFGARALEAGAAVAVVAGAGPEPGPGQAVIVVEDGLAALHALARHARSQFEGRVLGITGSNGKTTVKELILAAVGDDVSVSASPASFNSQVGVALSLLHVDPHAEWIVIECGVSEIGEMQRLAELVRPDAGVWVNVGDAHLAGFGFRSITAREKRRLFDGVPLDSWVVAPEEQGIVTSALADTPLVRVGPLSAPPSRWLPELTLRHAGMEQNLRLALAAAEHMGADPERMPARLASWRPAPMRLEVSRTPRGITIVNDAYTADPVSMEAALAALVREPGPGRSIAVLGEMAQLGEGAEAAHRRLGAFAVQVGVHALVGVGRGGRWLVEGARDAGLPAASAPHVDSIEAAAVALERLTASGDRVLLKASRPERLERLATLLFESVSPARLEVDLDAIAANVDAVRAFVGPDVAVMPVVKAFGYGIDAVQVATELERIGVDALCVAYPDEAVQLRDAGITRPILVQNVLRDEVDKVVRHGAAAQVGAAEQVAWLAAEAERQARRVAVHLKIDTGMGRAGVRVDEVPDVVRSILQQPALTLEGVFTHFAAADDPAQDAATRAQIASFEIAVRAARDAGATPRWVHACNSAGAARFPEAHHSMVRLGIGLYGLAASAEGGPVAHPVLRLTTRVVSVKSIEPDAPVGYGLTWRAGPQGARIAVVALGYNDGYPRALSNRGWMRVRGVRCPVVGVVCMDVLMLDVTAARNAEAGDEVVVFDDAEGPTITEAAALADTIPYELLTRLSGRVRRVFRRSR